jgi:hypothetical protein
LVEAGARETSRLATADSFPPSPCSLFPVPCSLSLFSLLSCLPLARGSGTETAPVLLSLHAPLLAADILLRRLEKREGWTALLQCVDQCGSATVSTPPVPPPGPGTMFEGSRELAKLDARRLIEQTGPGHRSKCRTASTEASWESTTRIGPNYRGSDNCSDEVQSFQSKKGTDNR